MVPHAWSGRCLSEKSWLPSGPHRGRRRRRRCLALGCDLPRVERLEDRTLLTAPMLTTFAAKNITGTSAGADATVNSEDSQTTVYLKDGTDPTLTSGSTMSNIVTVLNPQTTETLTGTMAGLTPDTTYYYEYVAQNASGTTNGQILSFTTLPGPPFVGAENASNIQGNTATFGAAVSPGGADTQVSFFYGTDPNLGSGTSTTSQDIGSGSSAVNVTASVAGLSPNTSYYVQAVATNANGTTKGSIQNFTTGSHIVGLPAATTQAASSILTTSATLNGNVNPEGADTTVSVRLRHVLQPGDGHDHDGRAGHRRREFLCPCDRAVDGTDAQHHLLLRGGGNQRGRPRPRHDPEFHHRGHSPRRDDRGCLGRDDQIREAERERQSRGGRHHGHVLLRHRPQLVNGHLDGRAGRRLGDRFHRRRPDSSDGPDAWHHVLFPGGGD